MGRENLTWIGLALAAQPRLRPLLQQRETVRVLDVAREVGATMIQMSAERPAEPQG